MLSCDLQLGLPSVGHQNLMAQTKISPSKY
jgi:hypothetical protein